MDNRSRFKSAIKWLVIQEMTQADYGVGKASTNSEVVAKLDKALKSAAGKSTAVTENPLNGKISFDDGANGAKFQVELVVQGETFDVTALLHNSDRFIAKGFTIDVVLKFIKDELDSDESKSYVNKSFEKGKASIAKTAKVEPKKNETKDEKAADEMEDAKETTQKEAADKATADVEEESDEEISLAQGGELVDKIEKIIDRILKGKQVKADAKTSFLKADKSNESCVKLTVKAKETPELKQKKS